jgi:hypothetical protein
MAEDMMHLERFVRERADDTQFTLVFHLRESIPEPIRNPVRRKAKEKCSDAG